MNKYFSRQKGNKKREMQWIFTRENTVDLKDVFHSDMMIKAESDIGIYSKSLSNLKEKMLCAYVEMGNSTDKICDKTFKELCGERLTSAKLWVKHSSYCWYEKLANQHILPYFKDIYVLSITSSIIFALIQKPDIKAPE